MILFILIVLVILVLVFAYLLAQRPFAAFLEPSHFSLSDAVWARGMRTTDRRPRVVVSFTTIPSRMHLAFDSVAREVVRQTLKPDAVYACIPYVSKRKGISYPAPPLRADFTIVRCEDWGPATKLLGCVEHEMDPDTLIITLDDDEEYAPNLIERLVFWASTFPDACIGFSALDCCLGPVLLTSFPATHYIVSPGIYSLEGFSGVVYRRRFASIEKTVELQNVAGCFVSDDLVLSRVAVTLGATLICASGERASLKREIDQYDALRAESGENERSRAYLTCQQNLLRAEFKTQYVWTKSYFLLAHHFDPCCFFLQGVSRAIDPAQVKDNDIICIRPECLPYFATNILPYISSSFILITCDSDRAPSQTLARRVIDDKRVLAWFSTTAVPGVTGIRRIPLGVDYFSAYFQVPSVPVAEQEEALNAARAVQRHAGVYQGKVHFRVWPHVASFLSVQLAESRFTERCEAALLGVHVIGGSTVPRKQLEVNYWRDRLQQITIS